MSFSFSRRFFLSTALSAVLFPAAVFARQPFRPDSSPARIPELIIPPELTGPAPRHTGPYSSEFRGRWNQPAAAGPDSQY